MYVYHWSAVSRNGQITERHDGIYETDNPIQTSGRYESFIHDLRIDLEILERSFNLISLSLIHEDLPSPSNLHIQTTTQKI